MNKDKNQSSENKMTRGQRILLKVMMERKKAKKNNKKES
jgi:hypothetical protein